MRASPYFPSPAVLQPLLFVPEESDKHGFITFVWERLFREIVILGKVGTRWITSQTAQKEEGWKGAIAASVVGDFLLPALKGVSTKAPVGIYAAKWKEPFLYHTHPLFEGHVADGSDFKKLADDERAERWGVNNVQLLLAHLRLTDLDELPEEPLMVSGRKSEVRSRHQSFVYFLLSLFLPAWLATHLEFEAVDDLVKDARYWGILWMSVYSDYLLSTLDVDDKKQTSQIQASEEVAQIYNKSREWQTKALLWVVVEAGKNPEKLNKLVAHLNIALDESKK